MKYHIVRFRVRQDALELVMGVTKKAEVEGIELLDVTADDTKDKKRTRQSGYVGGKKNKGITGQALILNSLPNTSDRLGDIFEKRGFARNSAHASTSKLMSEKKIIRDLKTGVYSVKK